MRILLVHDVLEWTTFDGGRHNQIFRNAMAEHLRIVANSICNNGNDSGAGWALESSPPAKAAEEPKGRPPC